MAAVSTLGWSRAAASVLPLGCIVRKSVLSLSLSQRWKRRLGSSFSGCRAANVGRRLRLDTNSAIKVGDLRTGPAKKIKDVDTPEDCSGFCEQAFLTLGIALMPLVDVEVKAVELLLQFSNVSCRKNSGHFLKVHVLQLFYRTDKTV